MLRPRTSKQRSRSVALHVETLEDRLAPAVLVQSTFDAGDEGWRVGQFFSNAGDAAPTFLADDGNPGGAIRTGEVSGVGAFQAPAAFLGNQSAAYGGVLHLEQRLTVADNANYPMVLLSDGNLNLQFRTPPPGTDWTAYDIPLVASSGWEVSDLSDTTAADPPASEAQLQQVLGNLTLFNLRADWRNGTDRVDLDNVRLESAATADLEAIISAPPEVLAGDRLTYTINVTNHGPDTASNVALSAAVPENASFVSFTPLAGGTSTTPAVGGGGLVSSTMPSLASGAAASFAMVLKVNPSADAGNIVQSATASSPTNDLNLANNRAELVTELKLKATDMQVTITDSPDPVRIGNNLTYTITIRNAPWKPDPFT